MKNINDEYLQLMTKARIKINRTRIFQKAARVLILSSYLAEGITGSMDNLLKSNKFEISTKVNAAFRFNGN